MFSFDIDVHQSSETAPTEHSEGYEEASPEVDEGPRDVCPGNVLVVGVRGAVVVGAVLTMIHSHSRLYLQL